MTSARVTTQPPIPMTIVPTVILVLLPKARRHPIGLPHLDSTQPRCLWGQRGRTPPPKFHGGHPSLLNYSTFWREATVRMIWLKPPPGMCACLARKIEHFWERGQKENLFFWAFHAFFCQFTLPPFLGFCTPFTKWPLSSLSTKSCTILQGRWYGWSTRI